MKRNKEDKFSYQISDECIKCGQCQKVCPVGAIMETENKMQIVKDKCMDCGTCSMVCPVNAANAGQQIRNSIKASQIDTAKLYLNPGCARSAYKPYLPPLMFNFLKQYYPNIKQHDICCRHHPGLPAGSTIIANCAGCDRRFRSLYDGIQTISFWELADSMEDAV